MTWIDPDIQPPTPKPSILETMTPPPDVPGRRPFRVPQEATWSARTEMTPEGLRLLRLLLVTEPCRARSKRRARWRRHRGGRHA